MTTVARPLSAGRIRMSSRAPRLLIALFCSGVRFDGGGFDQDSRDAIRFLASEATLDCSLDKPFSAAAIRCVVRSLFGAGAKLKPFSSTSTSDLLNCALVRFTTHLSRTASGIGRQIFEW